MSEELHVIEHHLDKSVKPPVYRLVVGQRIEHKVPVLDEDGEPVFRETPVLDERGNPVKRLRAPEKPDKLEDLPEGGIPDGFEETDEHQLTREQVFDTQVEFIPVEDFLFAADDDKWEGLSDEDVAKKQRTIVKGQLTKRRNEQEKARKAATRSRKSMPGAGEAL